MNNTVSRFFAVLLFCVLPWSAWGADFVTKPPQIIGVIDIGGIASAPPFIDSDTLYVGTLNKNALAFNLENGKRIWKKGFKSAVSAEPVKFSSLIIFTTDYGDGRILAIDANSLGIAWEVDYYGGCSSPLLLDELLIIPQRERLLCLNGKTGQLVWEKYLPGVVLADGLVIDDKIYVSTDGGQIVVLDDDGEVVREMSCESSVLSDLASIDGLLAIGDYDGKLHLLSVDNLNPLWEQNLPAPIRCPPLFYDQFLLCGSMDGTWRCYHLETGEELWEYKCPAMVRSNGAMWKQALLFAADDGYLYAIDIESGLLMWRIYLGGQLSIGMTLYGDRLYVPSSDNNIYILSLE